MREVGDDQVGTAVAVVVVPELQVLARARATVEGHLQRLDAETRLRDADTALYRAKEQGKDRARLDGALIEVPVFAAAKRLLGSGGHR